ncbi:hypothetical protein EDB83DRAFT_2318017 [Lactarius deliciosus]|nr:hypothetical protein EDB83DRAFT_2318017 [Lactarius deliciosus]
MPTHATGGRARPPRSPQHGRCQPSPMHPTPPSPCMPGMQEAPRPPPVPSTWAKPLAPGSCAPPRPRTPGGGSVRLASAPSMRGGPMRPPQTRPSPQLSASQPRIPEVQQVRRIQPPGLRAAPGGDVRKGEGRTRRGVHRTGGGATRARMANGGVAPPPYITWVEGLRANGRVGASEQGYEKEVTACPQVYAEGRVL